MILLCYSLLRPVLVAEVSSTGWVYDQYCSASGVVLVTSRTSTGYFPDFIVVLSAEVFLSATALLRGGFFLEERRRFLYVATF